MAIIREISGLYAAAAKPGFLGNGHVAKEVVQGRYADTDPFVLLMDDMLDKQDENPVGGPHPHAGFETVTLVLEGEIGDGVRKLKAGDLQMMTAGSGVVHTETISAKAKMRILQLWLILPKKDRWTTPRVQDLSLDAAPKISGNGTTITLYSGSLAGMNSPLKNYTPVIIADVRLAPGAGTTLSIPASYNSFVYVLEGRIEVGTGLKELTEGQTGWLEKSGGDGDSELIVNTQQTGGRFILYSGQPQNDQIVPHGPFIGNSQEDISRLYMEYRSGKMKHISDAPQNQRFTW